MSSVATEKSLKTEMDEHTVRFADKKPDWDSFADSKKNKRAQFRYVGAGGGKPEAWALGDFVPARNFTVSVVFVPPGGGGDLHGHREEEVFFCLEGRITVSWARDGEIIETGLNAKDMIMNPPGHMHGYRNNGVEPAYLMIMLGSGKPAPPVFAESM
jgi:mannose-6-phosphate isomerase-like protein (cupin superfamily)